MPILINNIFFIQTFIFFYHLGTTAKYPLDINTKIIDKNTIGINSINDNRIRFLEIFFK